MVAHTCPRCAEAAVYLFVFCRPKKKRKSSGVAQPNQKKHYQQSESACTGAVAERSVAASSAPSPRVRRAHDQRARDRNSAGPARASSHRAVAAPNRRHLEALNRGATHSARLLRRASDRSSPSLPLRLSMNRPDASERKFPSPAVSPKVSAPCASQRCLTRASSPWPPRAGRTMRGIDTTTMSIIKKRRRRLNHHHHLANEKTTTRRPVIRRREMER